MWVPGRSPSRWPAEAKTPSARRRAGRVASLFGLVLLGTSLTCSPPVPPPRNGGDWLVAPLPADPESLNFVLAGDGSSRRVGRLVADSLVDHNERLEMVPRLASSWEISEDQRTITFHLREGVQWHDGFPFTSEDVLFTYERILDPASGALSKRSQFLEMERVEAPDPLTIRVTYPRPFATALLAWETPILPRHIFEKEDFLTSPHNRAPVGTGPYRFVSWKTDQEIVLEANPDYWGGPPAIDRIVFKIIPSRSTQYQALLSGELDFAVLEPDRWMALRKRGSPEHLRLLRYPILQVAYIAWNGDGSHPALSDPRVRRALTLLTDRQTFLDKVHLGFGEVAASIFHPALSAHDPDLHPLPYDPQEGRRLLEEAGWTLPADGTIREKGGKELRFQLMTAARIDWQEKLSVLLQESFRKAGIRMDIRKLEPTVLVSSLRKGEYQAALSTWHLSIDPDPYPAIHSSQIGTGINYASYRNPEVDRLLEEGRRTLNPAERDRIFHRIGRILLRDQPYTFLFFFAVPLAMDSRFENVRVSPLGIMNWYPGILEWRVPENRRKYGREKPGGPSPAPTPPDPPGR